MPSDGSRFDVIIEKKIPLVHSVRALAMVNFGAKDTIPSHFQQIKIHIHNAQEYNAVPINSPELEYFGFAKSNQSSMWLKYFLEWPEQRPDYPRELLHNHDLFVEQA
ncbi:hypothetical protein Goari_005052 [Gossypium aridum]|uniref:UPF0261 domain-containing protein n=1 Tax=Gossypium aridum TaxID=34290 RepID=A0A7J8Y671_GOSAI|nr:hypothetical protein [Gossypium aridum]